MSSSALPEWSRIASYPTTEGLIFKMVTTRFLDVFEEEPNKIKRKCNYSDNHLNNNIILLRISEY